MEVIQIFLLASIFMAMTNEPSELRVWKYIWSYSTNVPSYYMRNITSQLTRMADNFTAIYELTV
jgi:hypothetical protein